MDYTEILQQIRGATAFDLYRLRTAIDRLLDDPKRIAEARRHIRPGSEVAYFSQTDNRMIEAHVLEFRQTTVLVENKHDQQQWIIPYYWLNVHGTNVQITERRQEGLGRNEVAVGEHVGFVDKNGREQYGEVTRLNRKTVTLKTEGGKWRVSYELLFKVLEAGAE